MKTRNVWFAAILAVFCWQSAISQDHQQTPSEKNPKAVEVIKQALLLENAGQFEQAIAKYQEVLKLEPKDFAAMTSIAGLFGRLQMPIEEEAWALKAIAANPKYFPAHINYGNGLAMQGKFDSAIKAYREAGRLAPKSPLPIYSQGVVAENQDRFEEALALYKKALEIDPKFEDGLFSAAAMHANLKQFSDAKVLLKKLLDLNPQAEDARQMLEAIDRKKP